MTFGGFDNTNLWLLTCQQLYQQEVLMIEYINTRIDSHCSSSENMLKIIWDAAIISLSISIMTFAKDLLGDSFRRRTFSRFNAFFDERKRKVQIDCPRREREPPRVGSPGARRHHLGGAAGGGGLLVALVAYFSAPLTVVFGERA